VTITNLLVSEKAMVVLCSSRATVHFWRRDWQYRVAAEHHHQPGSGGVTNSGFVQPEVGGVHLLRMTWQC
jgi:hypothetical protein